jgi:hypothetical protein
VFSAGKLSTRTTAEMRLIRCTDGKIRSFHSTCRPRSHRPVCDQCHPQGAGCRRLGGRAVRAPLRPRRHRLIGQRAGSTAPRPRQLRMRAMPYGPSAWVRGPVRIVLTGWALGLFGLLGPPRLRAGRGATAWHGRFRVFRRVWAQKISGLWWVLVMICWCWAVCWLCRAASCWCWWVSRSAIMAETPRDLKTAR